VKDDAKLHRGNAVPIGQTDLVMKAGTAAPARFRQREGLDGTIPTDAVQETAA